MVEAPATLSPYTPNTSPGTKIHKTQVCGFPNGKVTFLGVPILRRISCVKVCIGSPCSWKVPCLNSPTQSPKLQIQHAKALPSLKPQSPKLEDRTPDTAYVNLLIT